MIREIKHCELLSKAKENNRGYATMSILTIILLVSSVLLLQFYGPILTTAKNVAESGAFNETLLDDRKGKERLYSLLVDNVSFEGEANYKDIKKLFTVKSKIEDFTPVEIQFNDPTAENLFLIKNATDIELYIIVNLVNSSQPSTCDVTLMNNGGDMLEGLGQGLLKSTKFTVKKDDVYNKETNEVRYGEYLLELKEGANCKMTATVVYDELYYREIMIEGSNFEKKVIIEYNDENEALVRFKREGGF